MSSDPFEQRVGGLGAGSLRHFIQTQLQVRDVRDVRLLQTLIETGKLPRDKAEEFVVRAQTRRRSLIEQASEDKLASEAELLDISGKLYELEPVDLANTTVEDVSQILRPEQARALGILPYSRGKRGDLLVAISDPSKKEQVGQELSRHLPKEQVTFRLATRAALEIAVENAYRTITVGEDYAPAHNEQQNLRSRDSQRDQPAPRLFYDLLAQAVAEDASDIHLEPVELGNLSVRFRIDGVMHHAATVPANLATALVAYVKTIAEMATHEKRVPQDGRFSETVGNRKIDLRVVTTPVVGDRPDVDYEQAVIRLLDQNRSLLTLEELGMSKYNFDRYKTVITKSTGFAVTVGATGSGKTTTLYASLAMVATPEKKVISVEDPVELRLKGVQQIEVPRSGRDMWGFAEVLPRLLRSDPDILMIGEIRDAKTAQLAVESALTGHFVYSTLHTNNAITTIIRLLELGLDPVLVAETLKIVVAQRLIRRVCECADEHEATPEKLRELGAPEQMIKDVAEGKTFKLKTARPDGCAQCRGRGYRGRTGVHEVLVVDEAMQAAIINRADLTVLKPLAIQAGMRTMIEDGWLKVKLGMTTADELNRIVA
jgi:type II secretory ATPase GspE/PulE/Tfp pilus assembly ATPase PilB-like protein